MKDLKRKSDEAEDANGDTSEQFIAAEREYYLQKAKVDLITDVVQTTKKAAAAAQEKLDAARLGGELSARDKRDLDRKIEKYQNTKNSIGEIDTDAANGLLRTYEEELEFDMQKYQKKIEREGDKATDDDKS
jgi:hypothetical protein